MKTVTVQWQSALEIYDLFNSVFFGIVRTLRLANQGFKYELAIELCKSIELTQETELNYPSVIEYNNEAPAFEYTSWSGKKYRITHTSRISDSITIEYPSDSNISDAIDQIINK